MNHIISPIPTGQASNGSKDSTYCIKMFLHLTTHAPNGVRLSLQGDKESSLSSVRDGPRTSAGVMDRPSICISATCRAEAIRSTNHYKEPHALVKLRKNDVSRMVPPRILDESIHD